MAHGVANGDAPNSVRFHQKHTKRYRDEAEVTDEIWFFFDVEKDEKTQAIII